jgi:hypothetical protein
MKVSMLLGEEAIAKKADLVVHITHEDLTEATANTTQTLSPFTILGNNQAVELVELAVKTPFEDQSDAAFNSTALIVGDGGDTDRLLTSTELNRNGTEVLVKAGTGTIFTPTADDTIDFIFASMLAKSLVDIDKGELFAYFRILDRRPQ